MKRKVNYMSAKYNYITYGVSQLEGKYFKSECVGNDIVDIIKKHRENNLSPHTIIMEEQVHCETPMLEIKIIELTDNPLSLNIEIDSCNVVKDKFIDKSNARKALIISR